MLRVLLLPQDAMPRVAEIAREEDGLSAWYELLRCTLIEFREFRPERVDIVAVCDEEGRLAEKAPNPWTMLMGRPDFVGDVALVLDKPGGGFASVDAAWAERVAEHLRGHYEPAMEVITPSDPRDLPVELRAFLDPTGGVTR